MKNNKKKNLASSFCRYILLHLPSYFQDIQTNVERSMQSLMAAGSALGHRMLDMITRSPRLLPFSSDPGPQPPHTAHAQTAHSAQPQAGSGENFPDFKHCDCHFGKR